MSKTKNRHRDDESEESSSSSSDSSDSSSSSEQSDSSKAKSKNTKSKKSKLKHKKKEISSSSSSIKSNSESEKSPSPKKRKHLKHDVKTSKHSRLDKEQEYDNRNYNKYSHNRRYNQEGNSNNWSATTERSRWDSPNREVFNNEYVRRRGYNNYNRNENNFRYNNRNRDRGGSYRRNDMNRGRRDWRNGNRYRYDRNEQMSRNRDRCRSSERRDRYDESETRNRRSQDRRPYNREDNERRREDRMDKERRRSRNQSPRKSRMNFSRRSAEDSRTYEWGKKEDNQKREESVSDGDNPVDKEKPNFGLSGKLTEDTNKVNGIVIKYSEPPEARKPKRRWRLYPFKGEKALQTLYIHRQSCYLIGRDRKVCDLPVDHPSCSKQHAALQYRLVPYEKDDGTIGKRVRLYLIDLESANGTFLNNKPIEPKKYVELLEKDVIKFGFSSREYVLLHENSKEEEQDDDVQVDEIQIKEEPVD